MGEERSGQEAGDGNSQQAAAKDVQGSSPLM
jgi:hypothetical protein